MKFLTLLPLLINPLLTVDLLTSFNSLQIPGLVWFVLVELLINVWLAKCCMWRWVIYEGGSPLLDHFLGSIVFQDKLTLVWLVSQLRQSLMHGIVRRLKITSVSSTTASPQIYVRKVQERSRCFPLIVFTEGSIMSLFCSILRLAH